MKHYEANVPSISPSSEHFPIRLRSDVPSVSPSSSLSDYITKLTFRALDLSCNRNLLRLLILP